MSSFQHPQLHQFEKRDVWQIAWLIASDPVEFFRNLDFDRPLENYAYRKMKGKITDEIFRLWMRKRKRSDWALLYYSSRKLLQEALQHQGYAQPQLERYWSAWDCFMEIYAPQRPTGSRSLPPPREEQLEEIANLYNQRVQPNQLVDRETIEAWLSECIKALRNYQSRLYNPRPIDAPIGGDEDSRSLSESEAFIDPASYCQWEQLEAKDAKQLMAALLNFLPNKPESAQSAQEDNSYLLLLLKCGLSLSDRSIVDIFPDIFNVSHSQVNRDYNLEKRRLLREVAKWVQTKLGVTPDSETLEETHTVLEHWLKQYYQDLVFQSVFKDARQQLDSQYRKLLHLRYFLKIDNSKIAEELQMPESEVSSGLETGKREPAKEIAIWIRKHCNLEFSPELVNQSVSRIAKKVPVLIENYPDNIFRQHGE